jgi:RimJ/RimL family protein N-acetyltransferase
MADLLRNLTRQLISNKLHASVVDANIGSARILEKNAYDLEGRLKSHYFIEGKYSPGCVKNTIRWNYSFCEKVRPV